MGAFCRNTTQSILESSADIHPRTRMPSWNAPTLAATALIALSVYNGVRGALGDDSIVPDSVKPAKLAYVQALGFHLLMDACLMLVVVSSHHMLDDLPSAAPAGAFAFVFACLAPGASGRQPMKWNLATIFYSLQGLLIFLVGIAMLFGDDSVIPDQMKPLDSLNQLKLVGTTEFDVVGLYLRRHFDRACASDAAVLWPVHAGRGRTARRHRRLRRLPTDRRVGDGAHLLRALLEGKGQSEEAVVAADDSCAACDTKPPC